MNKHDKCLVFLTGCHVLLISSQVNRSSMADIIKENLIPYTYCNELHCVTFVHDTTLKCNAIVKKSNRNKNKRNQSLRLLMHLFFILPY